MHYPLKRRKREPKIVLFFDRKPQLFPVGSIKESKYLWFPQEIFPPYSDMISIYVAEHMQLVDTFKIHKDIFVYCYIRK